MPEKGNFTQSACVLLSKPVELGRVANALAKFSVGGEVEQPTGSTWMAGYPSLLVAMRPEVNGYVLVDVVDRPWPDAMAETHENAELLAAWSLGWFGPFVYPDALSRATAMAHLWPHAQPVASSHQSFIRLKTSYMLGPLHEKALFPPNYDPLAELEFLTDLARALLELPSALCYFNPNGEVLLPSNLLDDMRAFYRDHRQAPLPVWTNFRVFNLSDCEGWTLADTIGMEQLDQPDHEACFAPGAFALEEVDRFLRNSTDYVLQKGAVIKDGETMDSSSGARWRAKGFEESLAPRPRSVLRWLPLTGPEPPGLITR